FREADAARALRDRQHAADATDAAVERELPDRCVLSETPMRNLTGCGEQRERDREVEPRAFFAQLRRSEVDDDPALRPSQLGGTDRTRNTLLRLLARAISKSDDRKRRGGKLPNVRLDLYLARLETDECVRDCACEHVATVRSRNARVCVSSVTTYEHVFE